jgi:signal transduction histidine kinase
MDGNGKPTVLIVDDRRSSCESVSFALRRQYNCVLAESAEEGLDVVSKGEVSVVILDIRMPGMNGIDALRLIKQKDRTIEVIMLTGYANLETAKQSITHGAYGYLAKPFDVPDIRETVDKACKKRMQALGLLKERDSLKQAVSAMQKEIGNLSRLADVGWLSAGVVHEMKSPLTAILGYAEMMLKHIQDRGEEVSLPRESARYLATIKEETIRCAEMAKSLLDAARSGGPRPQTFLLSRILESIGTLISPQVHINHIGFRVDHPSEDLDLFADPDDVLQVLLNVILNSIHVMKSDRKELRIAVYRLDAEHTLPHPTPNERDFLRNNTQRSFVAFEVQDSGPGIPADQIQNVFDPFYTTTPERMSAGLGLPICREKIERNSGFIDIVTSSENGTTFRVLVPRPT